MQESEKRDKGKISFRQTNREQRQEIATLEILHERKWLRTPTLVNHDLHKFLDGLATYRTRI